MALVVSCEHGGNRIPARWRPLFARQQALLRSHAGYDLGALATARALAEALRAPLLAATVSRLLIDLNRSPHHRRLYSTTTAALAPAERRLIFERHYRPYRAALRQRVGAAIASGQRVLHLSCHSFTPELDGVVRGADLGLLYDPARRAEADFCRRWQAALGARLPQLTVRRNYPYRGTADGCTTELRRHFSERHYRGIEIEINQRLLRRRPAATALRQALADTLRMLLEPG